MYRCALSGSEETSADSAVKEHGRNLGGGELRGISRAFTSIRYNYCNEAETTIYVAFFKKRIPIHHEVGKQNLIRVIEIHHVFVRP